MEYRPKHPQPFSLSEALKFDPATITEEISRLQNSLQHLRRTQDELRSHSDDPELSLALQENEAVIASQAERISMLNIALNEKGVVASGDHYEPTQTSAATSRQPPAPPSDTVIDDSNEANDGGVML
ncbi:hypothetical protein DFH94DRAFT_717006 [Russula ochroleuca]|uniref:Uncharacterized protein n=1 Tax=Russula ochroleuca TaxID=152965 RepID=A0A9P5N2X0_9AGAM|nr:hypothetical protein DFH94DRAFT_717006 [Russula ochroleuca]